MLLADLQNEVLTITRRPDRTAETLLAVRQATLFCHRTDYYHRDLFETSVLFNPPAYFHQIDYKTEFPRYRALHYLRKFDPASSPTPGVAGKFFDIVTPTDVVELSGQSKNDVCYVAGQYIQLRSSTVLETALIGFYQDPITDPGTYDSGNSFIAKDFPFAIVYKAAAEVFKMLGDKQRASHWESLSAEQIMLLKQNALLAQGY